MYKLLFTFALKRTFFLKATTTFKEFTDESRWLFGIFFFRLKMMKVSLNCLKIPIFKLFINKINRNLNSMKKKKKKCEIWQHGNFLKNREFSFFFEQNTWEIKIHYCYNCKGN